MSLFCTNCGKSLSPTDIEYFDGCCEACEGLFQSFINQDYVPVTPAKGEPMPKTTEQFYKILAMDQELILEQKSEIEKLKMTINKLRQKNGKV